MNWVPVKSLLYIMRGDKNMFQLKKIILYNKQRFKCRYTVTKVCLILHIKKTIILWIKLIFVGKKC
jgi:hypothetical protein